MALYHDEQAQRMLLPALEQALDAVVIIDENNEVVFFNAAAEQLWGYRREEVLRRNIGVLAPSDRATGLHRHVGPDRNKDIDKLVGGTRELLLQRKDGSRVCGSFSVSKVNVDGNITYMGFIRDVTDEVQRRKKLDLLSLVADQTGRVVIVTDDREKIVYVNHAFSDMFGYTADEAHGQCPGEMLAGKYTRRKALAQLRRQMSRQNSANEEMLAYRKDGTELWVSAAVNAVRDEAGKLKNLIAVLGDITESKQIQSLQRQVLETLANDKPIEEIADLICRRVERIAPDIVTSILRVDSAGLLHPLGGPNLPPAFSKSLEGMPIGPDGGSCGTAAFRGEPVLVTDIATDPLWLPYNTLPLAAGLRACWSTPVKARDGRVIGAFAFYFREHRGPSEWHEHIVAACVQLCALAIERYESQAEITRLAYFDTLTGLPNRTRLRLNIESLISNTSNDLNIAVLFLDIDQFKDVNDTLGHPVGDELLVNIASRLRLNLRPEDTVGRHGGDEFVVVLPGCDAAGAAVIADGILDALASPISLANNVVSVSASIGISVWPGDGLDVDTLLKHADAAMYEAKRAGRRTFRRFSPEMNRANEDRLTFTASLRQAIARDELELYYQPQIRTADGGLYGVEALARWRDPIAGDIPPSKFIALAEQSGLIEPIGIWSLREAGRQMAQWKKAGIDIPCVSVNLSPIHFQSANLTTLIASVVDENQLAPQSLMLEITEGMVIDEHSPAIETMQTIRKLGVGLSMDDFGTGYSSLNRLAHLPINELKIDRSFLRDIDSDPAALAVATAIVRVGQSLNMKVVAEGVEEASQREIMAQLGCDVTQGYLHAPAMTAGDLEQWLVGYLDRQGPAMLKGIINAPMPEPRSVIRTSH
jgi:diguanylate cyclase (GGDEF)-like protein/PAS domain S-box-containing protein